MKNCKAITILLVIIILNGCSHKYFLQQQTKENTLIDHNVIVLNEGNGSKLKIDWEIEDKYINQLEEQEGLMVIMNPENILSLVNKNQVLSASYKPEDLVIPNVKFSFGNVDVPKRYLRKEASDALEEMFAYAKEKHINLYAISGYRAYYTQEAIFKAQVTKKGVEKANETVAIPGQSEHQTGLAIDVGSESNNYALTTAFAETEEGKWVKENAHKFGFIIRYPKEKEEITGYQFEPWHLRFVGVEVARIIYENDITLEDYFNYVKKI